MNRRLALLVVLLSAIALVRSIPTASEKLTTPQLAHAPNSPSRAAAESSLPLLPAGTRGTPLGGAHPQRDPALEEFTRWAQAYSMALSPEARGSMEARGVELARARQRLMADWIQTDPARVFDNQLPYAVRSRLPDAIQGLMEQPVNAKGDLAVLAVMHEAGEPATLPPVLRTARIGDQDYQVFTYGEGNQFMTRQGVPLYGLALPNDAASVPFATPLGKPSHLLALSESPARWLDPAEQAAREAARNGSGTPEPVCGVSRKPITSYGTETGFELGGNIHEFCGTEDAQRWLKATVAALGLTQPAGASGLLSTNVAASSYTEGRKKMLLMRPIWSDYSTVMTTNEALTHWQTFSNYMFEMSYGKLVLAALGKGSDITPPMLLPGLVADYDNTGLGALYENCKSTASGSYGYTLTQYDFLYVCTGSRPAASYCGLAFVGGVGFHLANRCWDPPFSGHEFGHNLGLNHAHFWDTTARSIIGDGQNMEYGDNNDPMGGGGSPNHYNSRYKNYLGWIKDADIADLNTRGSGTYRLYCFDLNEGSGLRGLKFRRNTTQNYWVNFRQRKTDKKGLMNGVQLLWTGNGNEGSYLLDVQLKGNADDNAIAIGRTFSDPSVGFHMTPVGKGNTYPESMDVVVQVGSFPSNHPPDARVIASTENPAPGDLVQLRADATDADGDPLAYYWTFGDGDYSTDNAPQASHAFPVAGEYLVQCTVSDMKGGVAHRTVVIRSGTPTTFRIRGHVLDAANRPLQGVRVFADATHFAYTDSDGSYSIVNLPPGTYSPDAIDGLAGTLSFAHPYFTNPVTVGPADADADFLGVPGPLVVKTPMIPSKAPAWRYWDSSVAPPATWSAGSFDDRTWKSGAAILGYGQGGESTILSYGSDPNNKYPTAYFRKSFVVKDPLAYASYSLEVLRDDGVIVYLNGSEIFRNNLPTGPVGFTTLAVDTVEPDSYLLASIPNTALLAGTNWITAEVHQATLNSSDLTFDLAFSGLNSSNVSGLNLAFLSQPADRGSFASGASIPVAATVHTVGALSEVAFYGDDALIGSLSAPPYELTWPSPTAGDHTLFCIARIGGLQVTSAPVRVTVDAPRPSPVALDLVGTGAEWRYLARASAAPTGWNKPGFDDTSWASGPQRLGFGHGDEATVINGGPSTARFNTLYFRHAFTVQDPASIDTLVARLKRDDGVAVYLNGIEILRDGLPQGTLLYATVATNAVDNGGVYHTFPFGADVRSLLAPGTNYLAAEVHQSSATSSDLEFELLLSAQAPVVRPRGAWVTSPGPGSIVPLPGALTLTGEAVAGDVGGIASVAFQIDGLTLAEDVTPPYSALWADPVPGLHSIVVIATDTDGATIASDPVSVTVGGVPRRSALISFGETWRYLDDGSDAGTAWTRASFDDRGWDAGAAPLGYGGNLEVTTLRQGTNSTHRNITAYFRHSILVNDPSSFTGLQLRLIRDDGAVVYVNGKEVFRSNLPGGLVSYNTLALQKIEGLDESTPVVARLPAALLSPGTNVIAVELHQQSPTDADAGFDLELTALTAADPGLQVYVATPADGARFNMPAGVPLSAEVTSGSPPIRVDYFANGLLVGTAPTFPFKVSWTGATAGSYAIVARAVFAGSTLESPPLQIRVGPTPPPISPVLDRLIAAGSPWRYSDSVTPAPEGWNAPGFDDSGWTVGNARLGFGLDGEATTLSAGRTSYYFRKTLTVANPAAYDALVFELLRDDGAVVYLNGHELYRSNMPDGLITPTTAAVNVVNTPEESTFFETVVPLSGSGLVAGSNVIAVEVHQQAASSTDLAFDLQLLGVGTTERRITLTTPSASGYSPLGEAIELQALLQTGTGSPKASRAEFFADGAKLGEVLNSPWIWTWQDAPLGAHTLAARGWLPDGTSFDSPPLVITVSPLLLSTQLLAPDAVWRYHDKGQNLGTGWRAPAFNDAAWSSGPARLGYGDDGEVTLVSFGPNAASKFITTYFRTSFTVPTNAVITNLSFRVQRDDGLAVFLNGKEMFRSNLVAGATYTTLASTTVSGADEQTWFVSTVTGSNVVVGTNLLAVEVHQSAIDSSDLGFAMELIGTGYLNTPPPHRPALGVVLLQDGSLQLSWPGSAAGYLLHSASTPDSPRSNWVPVTGTPFLSGDSLYLNVNPGPTTLFYRLILP